MATKAKDLPYDSDEHWDWLSIDGLGFGPNCEVRSDHYLDCITIALSSLRSNDHSNFSYSIVQLQKHQPTESQSAPSTSV